MVFLKSFTLLSSYYLKRKNNESANAHILKWKTERRSCNFDTSKEMYRGSKPCEDGSIWILDPANRKVHIWCHN